MFLSDRGVSSGPLTSPEEAPLSPRSIMLVVSCGTKTGKPRLTRCNDRLGSACHNYSEVKGQNVLTIRWCATEPINPGHEAFTPPPVSHPRIVTQNSRYDVHRDFGEVLQLFWRFCDRHFILLASPKGL